MNLDDLKLTGEAPFFLTEEGLKTLQGGYLLPGETPRAMYRRVAHAAASYYDDAKYYEERFFDIMWKNWLCPATPIASNLGTDRGLPISCLTGDTWLNTPNGGVTMQDVNVGDLLLTHEGRWRKVTDKKSRRSSGDLYELKVGTRLTKIKITGNHPVLTNEGWVRVDELDPNRHYIATNEKIEYPEEDYVIDMSNWIDYETIEKDGLLYRKSINKIKRKQPKDGIVSYYAAPKHFVPVTEDVAWALGLWCAEGSRATDAKYKENGIRITMGAHEQRHVDRFIKIMHEYFNLNGSSYLTEMQRDDGPSKDPNKIYRWISRNVNGMVVGKMFVDQFGINCKTKTLPQWIINLPKNKLHAFFEGMLVGDGHTLKNGTWNLVLSNPKLLLGMYNIALKLGYKVSLQMQRKPGKLNKTTYVYILRSIKHNSITLSTHNPRAGISVMGLRYCPIMSLNKLSADEEVFDISVDEDCSFSAAGVVVHNCNSVHVGDNLNSIFMKSHELAMLSKSGAGVGIYMGDVRGRGAKISGNGYSEGIVPWCKVFDTTTASTSQGGVRRGSSAIYLPIEHSDIEEFLNIRRPTGDINRRCHNINNAVCIDDRWMNDLVEGSIDHRKTWGELLKARVETGEPYMFFTDNVNNNNPECYKKNGLTVKTSNICSEVTLFTDPEHTFVCCLSSLNLVRWNEWKDTDTVNLAIRFLDAVMEEYIRKTEGMPGMEASRRSAMKGRAVGLGVLGWHTLLQENLIPMDSFQSMKLNAEIFRTIRKKADEETRRLAEELGEPEWCKGFGRRNTHTGAIAPTVSNSLISGGHSAGIEPISANIFSQKSAKGTFIRKNATLERLLEAKSQNTPEIWRSINEKNGSVQHLSFLSDLEKEVFLTAREINQHTLVKLAVQRQKWVDQAQSVNLFFATNASPKYIHEVHLNAWKTGLKTLYYLRSDGVIKGDQAFRSSEDCKACEA